MPNGTKHVQAYIHYIGVASYDLTDLHKHCCLFIMNIDTTRTVVFAILGMQYTIMVLLGLLTCYLMVKNHDVSCLKHAYLVMHGSCHGAVIDVAHLVRT